MPNEKEHNLILKLNNTPCLKCKKHFKNKEEIIFLKNSNIIHKKCFDELKRMFGKDDV